MTKTVGGVVCPACSERIPIEKLLARNHDQCPYCGHVAKRAVV